MLLPGDSLLIDLTEARVMDNLNPTSFDLQLARNFISEFTSLMLLPDTDTDAVVPRYTYFRIGIIILLPRNNSITVHVCVQYSYYFI